MSAACCNYIHAMPPAGWPSRAGAAQLARAPDGSMCIDTWLGTRKLRCGPAQKIRAASIVF
eukprot:1786388-Pleurochrysis_carterae.AAC.3